MLFGALFFWPGVSWWASGSVEWRNWWVVGGRTSRAGCLAVFSLLVCGPCRALERNRGCAGIPVMMGGGSAGMCFSGVGGYSPEAGCWWLAPVMVGSVCFGAH